MEIRRVLYPKGYIPVANYSSRATKEVACAIPHEPTSPELSFRAEPGERSEPDGGTLRFSPELICSCKRARETKRKISRLRTRLLRNQLAQLDDGRVGEATPSYLLKTEGPEAMLGGD